jgi:predicted GNAT family N-acyltransferase
MAVLAEHRGKNYGATVLDTMVAALPKDGRLAYLHAQEHALDFYLKKGFTTIGERFWEANIPHFRMVLQQG